MFSFKKTLYIRSRRSIRRCIKVTSASDEINRHPTWQNSIKKPHSHRTTINHPRSDRTQQFPKKIRNKHTGPHTFNTYGGARAHTLAPADFPTAPHAHVCTHSEFSDRAIIARVITQSGGGAVRPFRDSWRPLIAAYKLSIHRADSRTQREDRLRAMYVHALAHIHTRNVHLRAYICLCIRGETRETFVQINNFHPGEVSGEVWTGESRPLSVVVLWFLLFHICERKKVAFYVYCIVYCIYIYKLVVGFEWKRTDD